MAVTYYVIETKRQRDRKFSPVDCASFTDKTRAMYALASCQAGWRDNDYRLCVYVQKSVVIKPKERK